MGTKAKSVTTGGSEHRVLHLTTVPMSLTFLRGLAGYLRQDGFEVHALSSPGPELEAFRDGEGVRVYGIEMRRRITPLRDLRAVAAIVRVLKRVDPRIVHAHTPKGGLLGMIAAALAGVPVRIYHMRGLPMMGATGPRRLLLRWTEMIACRLAHRVLCVSRSLREVAIDERLCPAEKIVVLGGGSGQGVDAAERFDPDRLGNAVGRETRSRLGIPASAAVVGFVGRLVRDKGIVELAEAWSELRTRLPEAHLLLVGPWEPQDPVPAEVQARLESDPRVHLAGMDWDTPALFAAMDLVLLPSYREGFPNVPLEAAAMRLPVVATRIPGCVDAVQDGVTGTLVPPRDSRALAEAALAYMRDPDLRRRHGEAGRRRVLLEFRREVIWGALHREYMELLQARGLPAPAPHRQTVEGVIAAARP
jgi:glycosyltransferase involved in cell wall biosynthesis